MLPKHALDRLAYVRRAIQTLDSVINMKVYYSIHRADAEAVRNCLQELEKRFAQDLKDEIARRKIRETGDALRKEKGAEAPFLTRYPKNFLNK